MHSRYLVAHLPHFRLERCGWEKHQPVVLVEAQGRVLRVVGLTSAAQRLGVRLGMPLTEAHALAPAIQLERLNATAEQADLEALAEQLQRVTPRVATLPPDGLVAELDASEGLENESALLAGVRTRLTHLGHACRVVIADDPATAMICASWGRVDQLVPRGGSVAALGPLPLQALSDIPHEELDLLTSLGVRTVGAFASLPEVAVASRCSATTATVHRWARSPSLGLAAFPAVPARKVGTGLLDWRAVGTDLYHVQGAPEPESPVPANLIRVDFSGGRRARA